jgi:hypothetical protein
MAKLSRSCFVVFVNVLVLLGLFILTEMADRIHHDGFRGAVVNLVRYSNVPYSNLGTGNWVIYDAELGYRLNPRLGGYSRKHSHRPVTQRNRGVAPPGLKCASQHKDG